MRATTTRTAWIAFLGLALVAVPARSQQNFTPADQSSSLGMDLLQISQTFGKPGDYTEYALYFGERPEQGLTMLVVSRSGNDVWLELVLGGGQIAIQMLLSPSDAGSKIKERRMRYGTEVFLLPPAETKPSIP
jgi:hypothetical protein